MAAASCGLAAGGSCWGAGMLARRCGLRLRVIVEGHSSCLLLFDEGRTRSAVLSLRQSGAFLLWCAIFRAPRGKWHTVTWTYPSEHWQVARHAATGKSCHSTK